MKAAILWDIGCGYTLEQAGERAGLALDEVHAAAQADPAFATELDEALARQLDAKRRILRAIKELADLGVFGRPGLN